MQLPPERSLSVFDGRHVILFDLDGTLYGGPAGVAFHRTVDRASGLRVRHLVGNPDPYTAFDSLQAMVDPAGPYRSKTELLSGRFGITIAEMNRFRERFVDPEAFLPRDPLLIDLLDRLATRFVLALGTNNTPLLTERVLAALGVDRRVFRLVVSSEEAGAGKPDRRFFDYMFRGLGVVASDVVSVGDRPASDLDPAQALGCGTWAVSVPADLQALGALVPRQVKS